MESLNEKIWWRYLGHDLQELLNEAQFLLEDARHIEAHDFSFVIFPAAKAYEGFLKKLFYELGFINDEDYFGKHFRIGKSLNPNLPKGIRTKEVYGSLVKHTGTHELADNLWETWRVCRNLTFHWFPDEKNAITLPEAKQGIDMIINSIDKAFTECNIIDSNSVIQ